MTLASAEDVEERERRDGKMREENEKPAARSHDGRVGGAIDRGLFASAAGASVTSAAAGGNRKWRVGVGSYPASPRKLLCTALLAFLSPLWRSPLRIMAPVDGGDFKK